MHGISRGYRNESCVKDRQLMNDGKLNRIGSEKNGFRMNTRCKRPSPDLLFFLMDFLYKSDLFRVPRKNLTIFRLLWTFPSNFYLNMSKLTLILSEVRLELSKFTKFC